MSAHSKHLIIADISMSLLGRFGADGRVASIAPVLLAADLVVAGAGTSTLG